MKILIKAHLSRDLSLQTLEKSDLLAFLHSLTDEEFVSNPAF